MSRTVEIPYDYDNDALEECANALDGVFRYALAEALREAKEPIVEPKALGAVVKDGYGRRWVRVASQQSGMVWFNNSTVVPLQAWGDVQAVEILSEGWQG